MTKKSLAFPALCVLVAASVLSSASPSWAQKYVFNQMSGLPNSASTGVLPGGPFTLAAGTAAMAQGDFNGDGRLDIAVIEFVAQPYPYANSWALQIYLGQQDGSFAMSADYSMPGDGQNTGSFS